jgi:hypothetical protein
MNGIQSGGAVFFGSEGIVASQRAFNCKALQPQANVKKGKQ